MWFLFATAFVGDVMVVLFTRINYFIPYAFYPADHLRGCYEFACDGGFIAYQSMYICL